MTTDSLNLQAREIPGIRVESPPVKCIVHDNFYFYLCENQALYTFDSTSLATYKLPPFESSIGSSTITAIALSPSHTLGVACFKNGSIQCYDLTSNKAVKSFPTKSKEITHCIFLNDSTILCVDTNNVLIAYFLAFLKTLSFLMFHAIKETFSIKLDGSICTLLLAPVFHPAESLQNSKLNTESRRSTSNFNDFVCISTENSFCVARINERLPERKENLVTFNVKSAIATFSLKGSNNLLCAYAAPCDISLIKFTSSEYTTNRISDAIDEKPIHIAFISDNSLAIVFSQNSCLITSISDLQGCHSTIPANGLYLEGYHSIIVFSPTKLYEVKMITFEEKMESFFEKDDMQNAINLCRKAMKNDQSSTTGLPANESQKARVIERILSPFLEQRTKESLRYPSQTAEQADFLIGLAKDLRMTDWIVSGAVNLFRDAEQLPLFFGKIIAADPEAKIFSYTDRFFDLLLKNHGDLDITAFLLKLPSKVAANNKLLQYGLETKNSLLLARIYLEKLNDPVHCVTIYSHAKDFTKILEVLHKYINVNNLNHANDLLRWLFYSTQKEKLPFIRAIIRSDDSSLIDQIKDYITTIGQNSPITLSQFTNSCIYACSLENVPTTSQIHQTLENYILNRKIVLAKQSVKYLLPRIFTEENADRPADKTRESLLLVVLESGLEPNVLEALLPLCSSYKFIQAKKHIQSTLRKFDHMIKDAIVEGKEDVFDLINRQIRIVENENGVEEKKKIKKAMISSAALLISKNVTAFKDIFLSKFADSNSELLDNLTDRQIKNYYLRTLFSDPRGVKINIGQTETHNYIIFLCKYFPFEVRPYLSTLENVSVGDFLETCKTYNVLDACAVICYKIGEIDKSFTYLDSYLERRLYDYSNCPDPDQLGTNDPHECEVLLLKYKSEVGQLRSAFNLVRDFLTKGKLPSPAKYSTMLIKCFVLPLSRTEDHPRKSQVLCDYLRRLCAIAGDNMPFNEILRCVVVEFAPLNLGIMRSTLCGIINDYDYDIDTSKSLTVLFQQDEVKSQDKYLMLSIKGTQYNTILCGVCHGLLNEGDDCVKLFDCGHIFHNNCLKKQVCPICNPDERIDQDVERPTNQINPGPIFKRLKRFEYGLKVKQTNEQKYVPKKANLSVVNHSV